MKIDPATIKVGHIDSGAMSISFEAPDARYHIWVVQATGQLSAGIGRNGKAVLYKNSLHAYGHPEHYQTRYLDPESKANKKIVEQLIALSAPAVEEARAELAREKQAKADADAAHEQKVRWLDEAIARLDRDDGHEIDFNDVMTVLEFAKRMRAEHNT